MDHALTDSNLHRSGRPSMHEHNPPLSLGIEEEYHLVDRESRDVVIDPPNEMLEECEALSEEGQICPELLRSQIEVGTKVCRTLDEAREDLARLRRAVATVTAKYGLAPIAASTHPFAQWQMQRHTDKARYIELSRDMQGVARRLLICGMHVHIGIDDDELRVDLMNQFAHFLPLLLALSCSSPFWESENTGLRSYRLIVFDGFPRTGLPERFSSFAEYRQHIGMLEKAGVIEDATRIWWDLRLSAIYPTLEMRITDVCTHLEDALSLAALTVCIISMLCRLRREHKGWRVYPRILLEENRWRAMRYGCDGGLVDFATAEIVPCEEILAELVEMVRDDAERLGCVAELERTLAIPQRGSSAHWQIAAYEDARSAGGDHDEALRAVVDMLIQETVAGLQPLRGTASSNPASQGNSGAQV